MITIAQLRSYYDIKLNTFYLLYSQGDISSLFKDLPEKNKNGRTSKGLPVENLTAFEAHLQYFQGGRYWNKSLRG